MDYPDPLDDITIEELIEMGVNVDDPKEVTKGLDRMEAAIEDRMDQR